MQLFVNFFFIYSFYVICSAAHSPKRCVGDTVVNRAASIVTPLVTSFRFRFGFCSAQLNKGLFSFWNQFHSGMKRKSRDKGFLTETD